MNELKKILSRRPMEEWPSFREKADAEFEVETTEEMRRRDEVLPQMEIPLPSTPTYESTIDRNVSIPMRDGVVLRADVYRPDAEGQFPVLINRGPYDRRSTLDNTPAVARCFARRGYVVVCQDVRGRFGSEGEFMVNGESEDGADTVNWAGTQHWSNGNVGMFGISYNGMVCLEAAREQPPCLKAIYPGMIAYGRGPESGIQGMQALGAWMLWAAYGSEGGNPLRIDLSHLPLSQIDQMAGYESEQFQAFVRNQMAESEPSDAMISALLSKIETPTYMISGWYDVFVDAQLAEWQQLHEKNPNTRLMIGPYQHNLCEMAEMETPRIGKIPTRKAELDEYWIHMERFFDQHLKGLTNPLTENPAPIKLFVMGRNEWRDEYEWPPARTEIRRLYLHSDGGAGSNFESGQLAWEPPVTEQPTDSFDYDPLFPVHWTDDLDIWGLLMNMGDRNEVEARPDVLTYSSPVLEEDLEVTGAVVAKIFATSDAVDTDFFVTLVDVYPDGHTQYLTQGQIRARYRKGMDRPSLLTPGEAVEYTIPLQATSNVFQKGHQLRVEISSSDYSRHARNQNVADPEGETTNTEIARNQVLHTAEFQSCIELPVIPNS